jgi:membrane associated rhomboid family serine protease
MLANIIDKVRTEFRNGTMVHKLFVINVAVFCVYIIIFFFDAALHAGNRTGWADSFSHFFSLSSDWHHVITRFWSPFTCMFLHASFGHILFNMIGLMMFGNIVGDLIGDRRVLPIYLLGGLIGCLFYFISVNVFFNNGIEHEALGASGAVMALAGAAVAISPDYRLRLLLIGEVALKYVVLFMLLADLVGIASQYNSGGHFAHLGGFIFGLVFIQQINAGRDMSEWFNGAIDTVKSWFNGSRSRKKQSAQPVFKVTKGGGTRQKEVRSNKQEKLDGILDKIRLQGMASLTDEEKTFLESLKDS